MSQTKTFYYKFNPVNAWMIFNAVLFIMILHCCIVCPCLLFWWQTQVIIGVFIFSTLAWGYKYVLKHKMAVIDDEGITIDHCNKLLWKDVESAEEKTIRCWFKKYDIIVLNPKKGIDYKYNFLQRHNCRKPAVITFYKDITAGLRHFPFRCILLFVKKISKKFAIF